MSSQTKIIKDILSIYNTILKSNKIEEAQDVYDNVDFKDGIVKGSYPSRDNINVALLQDIEKAAKIAGVQVDITTAISGHESLPSRHPSGNAVDISMINGKAVSPSNSGDANKLVQALVSMGYTKNQEGSANPKAVLTFGVKGHDNHVHISNTTSSPSTEQPSGTTTSNTGTQSSTTPSTTTQSSDGAREFAKSLGKSILNAVGVNESRFYSSFGNNFNLRSGEIILPKESNLRIKTPVDGVVTVGSTTPNCLNKLIIKFDDGDRKSHLQYCGLEKTKLKTGQSVSKGDILGKSEDDVRITLYTGGYQKTIDPYKEDKNPKKSKTSSNNDYNDYNDYRSTSDNEYSRLLVKTYRDLKNNLFKTEPNKKIQENIDRIKGLIK
jgi:hypothetical protein